MDFDRTLATTKSGASPLQGRHTVDPDLAAICALKSIGCPYISLIRALILAFQVRDWLHNSPLDLARRTKESMSETLFFLRGLGSVRSYQSNHEVMPRSVSVVEGGSLA